MMKTKSTYILTALLIISLSVIVYQNFLSSHQGGDHNHSENEKQLYTCGMHPDIISEEPGNCPICEMKLTPVQNSEKQPEGERKILYWAAPMDPNEIYNEPGKSKMGMDLVPVYEDEVAGGGIVSIDPVVQQNINVKTEFVRKKSLSHKILTSGIISIDDSREYNITSRMGGWIKKLYISRVGQRVSEGELMMEIYSPELVAAQEEYLSALKYSASLENSGSSLTVSGQQLIESSIKKLKLLDLSDAEIEKIAGTKKVREFFPIYAPDNGTVLMKQVLEGDKIIPGSKLLHIADLSKLWVIADIYEYEFSFISKGDNAEISFSALPGKIYRGEIDFIYPTLDKNTRTIKVRIVLDNSGYSLKPNMLAKVKIVTKATEAFPVVSEQSVIRSGNKNIVILAMEQGKFKPIEVGLGLYSEGYYQVKTGLAEGMKIVTSAQFLIDSESNLRAAIKSFSGNEMDPTEDEDHNADQNTDVEPHSHAQAPSENEYGIESPLIRTGIIDVEAIDENGDNSLYECPMDWNIISDESGRCPACEMKLKEYSIEDIKKNLDRFGYQYKKTHNHGGM